MAIKTLALWLLLLGTVLPQVCCQHWSYGLSPGGKRELDSFSDTKGDIVKEFPNMDTPCSVLSCAAESPFAKLYKIKGLLGSMTARENGYRAYKK